VTRLRPRLGIDYTIRGAYPFEGPVIGDLYQGTVVAELDWERPLDASWVIVTHPTEPQYYAALSLVASQPIGRLEMLRVRTGLTKRLKSCIVRDLIHYSLLTLRAYGCQAVTAFPEHDPSNTFQNVIQRRFKGQRLEQTCSAYITRF
jgi:hypothetical protein